MSLVIHPDPQERVGGYAFFELPEGSLPDETVMVSVFDAYSERWLAPAEEPGERVEIGNANWQSEHVEFGPYQVHNHDGADWVRVGPEIVNKLDEYMPLRITVGQKTHTVSWPDMVPPRAGAAVLGGLKPVTRKRAGSSGDQLVGAVHQETLPETGDEPELEHPVETDELDQRKGSLLLLYLFFAAVVMVLLAVWYFWPDGNPEQIPPDETVASEDADNCSLTALGEVQGGFGNIADAIRECGTRVSPDTALMLIEEAAAREDGVALLLFGTLYDGTQLDPRIENLIGLSFDDDPAKAVEYYARAEKVGAEGARDRLQAICELLSVSKATLAKGAYDDFCS